MIELHRFCAGLGLDEDGARAALASERGEETSALAMPWYVRMVVGAGAWITALVAIGLGAAILYAALEIRTESAIGVLGLVYLAGALSLLRGNSASVYLTQLGIAVAAAGVAMIAAGAGLETEDLWAATAAGAVATVMIIVSTSNRVLQFLSALFTGVLLSATLIDNMVPYYFDIVSLAGLAGVLLMLRPLQRDLQPLAVVLLLVFPALGIFSPNAVAWLFLPGEEGGLFAKGLHIAIFLWLVVIHWRQATTPDVRERLAPFAAAAILVCILLPPGGSAALVIMMLAFVLGSRPLALLGALLQIHYIWRFYYDLDATLLTKSGVLMAVGVVLVAAWWLMWRRSPEGVRL